MIKEYKPVGVGILKKKHVGNGNLVGRMRKRNQPEKEYFTGEIPIKPIIEGQCFICDKKITYKKGNPRKICSEHTYSYNLKTKPQILKHVFMPNEM